MRKSGNLMFALLIVVLLASGCGGNTTASPTQTAIALVVPEKVPTITPTLLEVEDPTPLPTFTATVAKPPEQLSYVNPKKYEVTYSVLIKNDNYSPSDIQLYLPVPGNYDSQTDMQINILSPEPFELGTDPTNGNQMVYWQLTKTPASGSTTEMIEKFTFITYETTTTIDITKIQPYDINSDVYKMYTQPEKYIESNDPKIIKLADEIAGTENNPYLLAKKFYNYIIENVEYKILNKGLNGAKFLLSNGKGECGDYSALFIALSRAKGIPARSVVGYWAVSGNDQTHVWSEFFLEGIGWIPVDATIGQQDGFKRGYYFGHMDSERVILSKGFNTPLLPEAPGKLIAPILQVPLYWYWGSGNEKGITFERNWEVKELP